eukprot:TRINITY_DN4741_c0_g1_i5.p1 TRINITY_DN4741_c0_g1~~TRINITY_DN4741_c0_g1_i5.p1  ORF type:complete len:313 (+),score=64.09 TRINITY_DN4741_c0_g1_i5:123-1061(+)
MAAFIAAGMHTARAAAAAESATTNKTHGTSLTDAEWYSIHSRRFSLGKPPTEATAFHCSVTPRRAIDDASPPALQRQRSLSWDGKDKKIDFNQFPAHLCEPPSADQSGSANLLAAPTTIPLRRRSFDNLTRLDPEHKKEVQHLFVKSLHGSKSALHGPIVFAGARSQQAPDTEAHTLLLEQKQKEAEEDEPAAPPLEEEKPAPPPAGAKPKTPISFLKRDGRSISLSKRHLFLTKATANAGVVKPAPTRHASSPNTPTAAGKKPTPNSTPTPGGEATPTPGAGKKRTDAKRTTVTPDATVESRTSVPGCILS